MKLLVDAMLGKLARFLRIFGYDTVYANDLEDYFGLSPVPDEKLKQYAEKNDRIIITKDLPFYNIVKENSIYLEGEGVYNYLNQLKVKLDLDYDFNIIRARCSVCNSTLGKVKDKIAIKDEIKQETFKHFNEFYRCLNPNCRKIYWKGSHIDNIINKLKKKLKTE